MSTRVLMPSQKVHFRHWLYPKHQHVKEKHNWLRSQRVSNHKVWVSSWRQSWMSESLILTGRKRWMDWEEQGGAGAAALSWRWLTDHQIIRVMSHDCRGLCSRHQLTQTQLEALYDRVRKNTPIYTNVCRRISVDKHGNIIFNPAANRRWHELTYAPHCRMTHENAWVSSLLQTQTRPPTYPPV